jgi:hypothetical protein
MLLTFLVHSVCVKVFCIQAPPADVGDSLHVCVAQQQQQGTTAEDEFCA